MPKEGYSSVTISNETKQRLGKLAEKNGETIPETIKRLLNECKTEA